MRRDPLTFLQSLSGFVRAEAGRESANRAPAFATVDPAYDVALGQLPRVTFDGESTMSGRRYASLNGYRPTAGDRVLMLPVGHQNYVIIGSVEQNGGTGFAADPAAGIYTTYFAEDSYVQVDSGEAVLRINGNTIHPNSEGVAGTPLANHNTTSASYVDLGGPASFPFTKREDGTRIRIDMHATLECSSVGNSTAMFGVRIDGTDYDVFHRLVNPINERHGGGGTVHLSSIPAGVFTIQGRWKRIQGTATLARYTAGDWTSIAAMEVD